MDQGATDVNDQRKTSNLFCPTSDALKGSPSKWDKTAPLPSETAFRRDTTEIMSHSKSWAQYCENAAGTFAGVLRGTAASPYPFAIARRDGRGRMPPGILSTVARAAPGPSSGQTPPSGRDRYAFAPRSDRPPRTSARALRRSSDAGHQKSVQTSAQSTAELLLGRPSMSVLALMMSMGDKLPRGRGVISTTRTFAARRSPVGGFWTWAEVRSAST